MIKRLILLICVVILIVDLGEDGILGKAQFVAPQCQHSLSFSSSINPVKVAPPVGSVVVELPGIANRFPYLWTLVEFSQGLTSLDLSLHGSSGGIPL